MDIQSYLKDRREIVEEGLRNCLPSEDEHPQELHRAMRYSVFSGGKRLRPILTMAGAEAVGGDGRDALPVACAIEIIHTYSLIHDDLPAMDDDDLRRGLPTSHKVFGEAMAILAGDALLTLAFQIMAHPDLTARYPSDVLLAVIHEIATSAGVEGMGGGQAVDIHSEGKEVDEETVRYIHTHKTGAMIRASVKAGAMLAGGSGRDIESLSRYGEEVGLAFQIIDDILDIEGEEEDIGKRKGTDLERGKVTYPSVLGMERARSEAASLIESAIKAVKPFGERGKPLIAIARYIISRSS